MSAAGLKMQKVVQAIAVKSRRPDLAFTLGAKWADGNVGPSTAAAVNLILRTKYSVAFVRGNPNTVTAKLLKAAGVAPAPGPARPLAPTAPLKNTSLTIPITTDTYLLFHPKIGFYTIHKKIPNRTPLKLGEIHVYNISKILKITGNFSVTSSAEMRKRLPMPSRSYAVLLNGKPILKRGISAAPPPVSPFVSPKAPPGSTKPPRSLPSVPETEAYLQSFFAQSTAIAGYDFQRFV